MHEIPKAFCSDLPMIFRWSFHELLVFLGEIPPFLAREISQISQESPSSVEAWVVRAISEGVIDGRIDQLNRKVPGGFKDLAFWGDEWMRCSDFWVKYVKSPFDHLPKIGDISGT